MSDRRGEILNQEHARLVDGRGFPLGSSELIFVYKPAAISAMDEYMKECCLDLLAYMAKNKIVCGTFSDDRCFNYKGQWITKEQLFENFL